MLFTNIFFDDSQRASKAELLKIGRGLILVGRTVLVCSFLRGVKGLLSEGIYWRIGANYFLTKLKQTKLVFMPWRKLIGCWEVRKKAHCPPARLCEVTDL